MVLGLGAKVFPSPDASTNGSFLTISNNNKPRLSNASAASSVPLIPKHNHSNKNMRHSKKSLKKALYHLRNCNKKVKPCKPNNNPSSLNATENLRN